MKRLFGPRRKLLVSAVVFAGTCAALGWYLRGHPEYVDKLRHTSMLSVAGLVAINMVLIVVLSGIYYVLVCMVGKRLPHRENILLTIYSSIANFFGPLQSGPGVRAVYLRSRHHVRLRDYTFVTLIYYAIYAALSALFLLGGTRPWWQAGLAVAATAGLSGLIIAAVRRRNSRSVAAHFVFSPLLLGSLFSLTALQLSLIALRYYVELSTVQAGASLGQSVSYAGAANFALFVSVTPDGVGIREGFLLAAQSIHTIPTSAIVAASLLDRASYIVFLGVLLVVAVGLHAKARLFGPGQGTEAAAGSRVVK